MVKRLEDGRVLVGILNEVKVIKKEPEKAPEVTEAKPKKAKKKSAKK